jgi:hypothetical protein
VNLLAWLERYVSEGEGRLELWQFGKPQECVKIWPLRGAQTVAARLAADVLSLANAPVRHPTGYLLFVYPGGVDGEPARARALLRDGTLMTNDSWSSSLLDGLLEDVLERCEESVRLQRQIDRVRSATGLKCTHRKR